MGYRNSDRRARGNSARPCYRAPAPDSGTASNGQGHIGVGGQPDPFSRQHGVPQGGYLDSGEDPRPRWQTARYLPRSTRTSPPSRSGQRPGAVSCCPTSFVRVAQGHERPTMDRRPSAVLTHVLAGRTRHRRCRTHGATLTRAAKRPRVAAAVGASTRLVAQALLPSNPTTTSRATIPSSQPEHHPRPWPC